MVILLTGASRGIGASLARTFTQSGHTVVLVSRNRPAIESLALICNSDAGKILAHAIPFDLSDLSELESEFTSTLKSRVNQIDALLNNAGQLIRKPFEQIGIRDARMLFEVNFFVPAQLIRICIPLMAASSLRHVVNISSMAGFQGSSKFSGLSYYSASKAALASLTECLATELAASGIKVNALALGSVQTEMLGEAFPDYKAPLEPVQMAEFIKWFTLQGSTYFNGKILPVSVTTP